MEGLLNVLLFLVLMSVGYFSGRLIERRHYQSIKARERTFLRLPAVTIKRVENEAAVAKAVLVTGSAVISVDYFKRFLSGLRNMFGGRVTAYETLIDRARREAILRMKAEAPNADIIMNMRIETSSISKGQKQKVASVEALAYGTAITYAKDTRQPASQPKLSHQRESLRETGPSSAPVELYAVVFSGDIAPGEDLDTVKARVARLYKVPVERCEYLFTGTAIPIKEGLEYPTAQKYHKAFQKTGAVCRIEPR